MLMAWRSMLNIAKQTARLYTADSAFDNCARKPCRIVSQLRLNYHSVFSSDPIYGLCATFCQLPGRSGSFQ